MTDTAPVQHQWVVMSIAGVPTVDPRPMLSLGPDGQVAGTTGVNRIRGRYEAHGETIKISGAGMTRMSGSPVAMEQERRFLATLEGWHAFHRTEAGLELGRPDEGLVLVAGSTPETPAVPQAGPPA